MFDDVRARQDVYRILNDQTIWYRNRHKIEYGRSFYYLPTHALLRELDADKDTNLGRVQQFFIDLYKLKDQPPSVLLTERECNEQVSRYLDSAGNARVLLFEGYVEDSAREGRDEQEEVARMARQRGLTVLQSPGQVVDRWHDKTYFRSQARKQFGCHAVPKGRAFVSPSAFRLLMFAWLAFLRGNEKVVFKINGAGGEGNFIVQRMTSLRGNFRHLFRKIQAFCKKMQSNGQNWVSAEYWQDWSISGATSYFVHNANAAPLHMAIVQQHLGRSLSSYRGARSFLDLSVVDQAKIAEFGKRMVQCMQEQGLRGFLGVDWILSDARGGRGELLLPDSGLAFRFIEATARVGGHNQELRAISLIARRDHWPMDEMIHSCLRARPLSTLSEDCEGIEFIGRILGDVAMQLDEDEMRPDQVYFLPVYNQFTLSPYGGSIILFGRRSEKNIERILHAERILSEHNVLAQ